jgi:hypothetical protein
MACVATLSRVEIDIFLSSASSGQQAIVRALRDIITRRASGLAERVSTGKELKTAARTVTVHLMPYDGENAAEALGKEAGRGWVRTHQARSG